MQEQIIITKAMLIKDIAKQTHMKVNDVKIMYNTLESTIFDKLSSTNVNNDISIRLFEGVTLDGIYTPETTQKNNLTGEVILIEGRIKPKFSTTRYYREKLNQSL